MTQLKTRFFLSMLTTLFVTCGGGGGGGGTSDAGTGGGSGSTPDTTPPTVTTVVPAASATGIATNSSISVTFSEAMNAGTITATNVYIVQGTDCGATAIAAGAITPSGNTYTFTPSANLSASQQHTTCVTTGVQDSAGNALASQFTASWTTGAGADVTPPAVGTAISFGTVTSSSIVVNWGAATDAVTAQASLQYRLVKAASAAAIDTILEVDAISGGDLLVDYGTNTLTHTATGLTASTAYHFAVVVRDAAGNKAIYAPNNQTTSAAAATPSDQIAAIRAAIAGGTATTVLSHDITGGIVSYTKATVGSYAVGTMDGPGFFIQNDNAGPAIFVALDPAAFAGGVAAGDTININATEGKWLSNGTNATSSMYVITAATGSKTGTGTIPTAQNVSAVTFPGTLGANWEYESERVTASGTIAANFAAAGADFVSAQITTTGHGTPASTFILRMPAALYVAKGLASGCTFTANAAPITRFNNNTQISAWVSADVTVNTCPALSVSSTTPAEAASGVAPSSIAVTFSAPLNTATVTGQTSAGACSGTIQVSTAAADFATCVAFTSATPTFSSNNTVATLTLAAALANTTTYKIRVTTAAQSANGNALGSEYTLPTGFTTAAGNTIANHVVISEVSTTDTGGTGACSGANCDYIELYNPTASAVNINGWIILRKSAANSFNQQTITITPDACANASYTTWDQPCVIPAKGFFLLKSSTAAAGTTDNAGYIPANGANADFVMTGGLANSANGLLLTSPLPARTGSITSGSAVITGISVSTADLALGTSIAGTGIPAGATVVSIDSASQVTLSIAATATNASVALTLGAVVDSVCFGTHTVSCGGLIQNATRTAASNVLTGIPSTANLAVGNLVTGTGIPASTTITAILSGTSVELSQNASAGGTTSLGFTTGTVTNAPDPAAAGAIERKAQVGSTNDANAATGMLTGGGHASHGNGQDTNVDSADWLGITATKNPQNRYAGGTEQIP